MKIILILISLLMTVSTYAASVDGQIFYQLPSGDLAEREVSLTVPSQGQGEVVLSGKTIEWSTSNFWSETVNKETLFYAVFKTSFQEFKSTMVLKGTYIKANNKIIYYGSVYKKEGHHDVDKDISDFTFSGGFNFSYDR